MPGFPIAGEMSERIQAMDWSASPLGPIENWSPSLRMMVGFMLANRFPLLLWWGAEYISIYNDAYRPILGAKHPWALGKPVSQCWSEIWDTLKPLIDSPFNGGPSTWLEDFPLEINRYGFVEETHFTVAYSPVPDETAPGGIGGVLATVHEITEKVIAERRVGILRDLGARVAEARTAEDACAMAAALLSKHPEDLPFALLYLIEEHGCARLAGAAGVEADDPISPRLVRFSAGGRAKRSWPLSADARVGEVRIVEDIRSRFERVGKDPPEKAVIVPIASRQAEELAGFLVAGVSPRLRFDQVYRDFLLFTAAQISTAIANARAHEQERARVQALAEIDRAKTAFFANVSHEFRTPLTLILGPLEDALRRAAPGLDRDRIEVARRNARRMLKLVNTLLDFTRIEAGRAEAVFEPVDLAALTAELVSNFRSLCEQAGLELIVDCPPLSAPVAVDRDMWEKIVLNLVSNAFKFTFAGKIVVSLRAVGSAAELTVRDTGVGIPLSELPHLFERFRRIEGQRSRTYEGSGIGLALVRELARLLGGTIEAESWEGEGSNFRVSIPLRHAVDGEPRRSGPAKASRAEAFIDEASRWLPDSPAEAREASAAAQDARILIADDNADMRDYLRSLLQGRHQVEAVADGEAALAAARAQPPDLILADVMMPHLDGLGLVRAIRADPALSGTSVILLSARAGEESRVAGLETGADDYLVKPFSARDLLARVESNLKLAELRAKATETLRLSEERYRQLVEQTPDGIFVADRDGHYLDVSPAGCAMVGMTREEVLASDFTDLLVPEEHHRIAAEVARFEGGTIARSEWRMRRKDGSVFDAEIVGRQLPSGNLQGLVRNVSERKRDERRQRLLLDELNHRVKNSLATVQSLAVQSLRDAADLAAGLETFEARLIALSKTHDVLTREHWEGADLREIVESAMAPYQRVTMRGPRGLILGPQASLALAMAIHELATNAVKHGALSVPAGRVEVDWRGADGAFEFQWREQGGPPASPPTRRGFGTRLISHNLAKDLHGEVDLTFASGGVACAIRAPLGQRKSEAA